MDQLKGQTHLSGQVLGEVLAGFFLFLENMFFRLCQSALGGLLGLPLVHLSSTCPIYSNFFKEMLNYVPR